MSKHESQPQPQAPDKPLRIYLLEQEVSRWPEWQRCFYELMVESGTAPVLAHMLACQQAPQMGQSDRSFCESLHRKMSGLSQQQRSLMVEIARRNGINTDGKFYVGGLGTYGDPRAWCSTIEDARTALKDKPWLNMTGLVNKEAAIKAENMPPPPRKVLADDLAQEMMTKELQHDPKLRERVKKGQVKPGELRELVEDKYAYKETKPAPLTPLGRKLKTLTEKKLKQMAKRKAATA